MKHRRVGIKIWRRVDLRGERSSPDDASVRALDVQVPVTWALDFGAPGMRHTVREIVGGMR